MTSILGLLADLIPIVGMIWGVLIDRWDIATFFALTKLVGEVRRLTGCTHD